VNRVAHVTELHLDAYTEYGESPLALVGRRVKVMNDEINPRGLLGAWFVTGIDPQNTAHVIVAKVDEYRLENWSIHNCKLRIRP